MIVFIFITFRGLYLYFIYIFLVLFKYYCLVSFLAPQGNEKTPRRWKKKGPVTPLKWKDNGEHHERGETNGQAQYNAKNIPEDVRQRRVG